MNPLSNASLQIWGLIRDYSKRCKLDVFIQICMLDYVGYNKVDTSLNVHDVCCQILTVKERYIISQGNIVTDTPDEIIDKSSALSDSLPDGATTWSIQLCSSFLSAITENLADYATTESGFLMPYLTILFQQ